MSGLAPANDTEVNMLIGSLLRQFVLTRETVHRYQAWLASVDLTKGSYALSVSDQTDLKTAISGLDTALQAVDLTFISRCTGLY